MHLVQPTPVPIPEGLSEAETAEYLRLRDLAHKLRHTLSAGFLSGILCESGVFDAGPESFEAFVYYMTRLKRDASHTGDPMESFLIEQIAIAHHNLGLLSARAATAENIERFQAYDGARTRLLSEFRRCILALKEYREPHARRQLTVVEQQNVAQNQQVAYVAADRAPVADPTTESGDGEKDADSELGSNGEQYPDSKPGSNGEVPHRLENQTPEVFKYGTVLDLLPQSKTGSRRPEKPNET